MNDVELLVARAAISDVISRYCLLFDDQDWDGLAALWTRDAAFVVDDVAFDGCDAVVDFLRNCLPAGYQSKHVISPPVISVAQDGASATARTDVVWIAGNFENTIVARYDDDLVCTPDGWRIRRRVERPMQFAPGPPPMSDAAVGVSASTMRTVGRKDAP